MPRLAANLSLMFNELPFLDRFDAAAGVGFQGVEYLFPYDWPARRLEDALSSAGLNQVLFNLPPGDWAGGERGIACLPGRQQEFRRGLETAIDYAQVLGCRQLNCLAGIRPQGVSLEQARDTLVDNLTYAASRLAPEGIGLLLEPINSKIDMPGYLVDTPEMGLAVLDGVAMENLRLQLDIYHLQVMAGDVIRHLRRCLPVTGHIQIADNPGRHEPGTGELNFNRIFEELNSLGYPGWVGCEYHPLSGTREGLSWLDSHGHWNF